MIEIICVMLMMVSFLAVGMARGCAWDLLIFGDNLDASGADVRLEMLDGMDLYTSVNAGLDVQPKELGSITGFTGQSEDGALVDYRIGLAGETNKQGGTLFQSSQTEGGPLNRLFARCMRVITLKDLVQVWITNAAQKFDCIGLLIGKGIKPKISSEPFGELPAKAVWVEFTTAHTSTADKLVFGDITFPDFTLKQDSNYKVLALGVHGATMLFWQFQAKSGPDVGNRPGCIGGDTDQINHPAYFSHPFQFVGKDGAQLGTACSASDTSSAGMMLLEEIPVNTS